MDKYFKGVFSEAKRVEWPHGKKLRGMVISVLVVSAIFGVIFFFMDMGFTGIMRALGI